MLRPGRYVHVEWSMHFGISGHGMDNVTPICAKQRFRIPYEMKTNPEMKAYRGGCTDKNWSNTTTCPDWCNDSKHDVHLAILTCRLVTLIPIKKSIKADSFPNSAQPNSTANIYHCPGRANYYCNLRLSSPCQSGKGLVNYTHAEILGAPPISSTRNVITPSSPIVTTFTSFTEPTASVTLTNQPTCTDIIHQSSLPATAIGVGLGVPFGIAAIGFLIFLFWRDARSKKSRRQKQDTLGDMKIRGHNTLAGGEMDGNGLRLELQGTMTAPELHGNEMLQQPNDIAPPMLEPIQPLMLGDRPLD